MHANIAFYEGTENRVDECVQHDIGIGMTGQSPFMRNAYPTQHDVVTGSELVDIEAEPHPDICGGRQ